ncbi:hypothetical protein K439DRAFT_1657815 [Ramaria rubella]|nr:hypothetical protein K439DRAFT_1657815 [Ramaria rubella]
MYSRSLATLSYIALAILFATFAQIVSAAPSGRTPGDVVSENRNMACRLGACYIKNATDSSSDPVADANAAASAGGNPSDSTAPSSVPVPAPPVVSNVASSTNGANFYKITALLPVMITGTSFLLLL